MFPACCFRQRTCVALGLLNGVLSETSTHSCLLYTGNRSEFVSFKRPCATHVL